MKERQLGFETVTGSIEALLFYIANSTISIYA